MKPESFQSSYSEKSGFQDEEEIFEEVNGSVDLSLKTSELMK